MQGLPETLLDELKEETELSDPMAVEAAARLTLEAFGSCNVLCANVGVQQFGAVEREVHKKGDRPFGRVAIGGSDPADSRR